MSERVALFWPGDSRDKPNELALPSIQAATAQLERALRKLGREPYRVEGFLTRSRTRRSRSSGRSTIR